jgi:hypothetical protein
MDSTPLDDGLARDAGPWVKDKLGILRKYLPAFGMACRNKAPEWFYVEGFAGPGVNRLRDTGELVWGSSMLALQADPMFAVAVVRPDRIPIGSRRANWRALPNVDLVMFIEAKRLVVCPMLLAQFVGIVHEITPTFLNCTRLPYGFRANGHFYPCLVSIGYLHLTSSSITDAYRGRRSFLIAVLPNSDIEIARLRWNPGAPSPLSLLSQARRP